MERQPDQSDHASQGLLFRTEITRSGATDPAFQRDIVTVIADVGFEEAPSVELPTENIDLVKAVHEAIKTDNRRRAQAGKHSPVARGEDPVEGLRPGDFVPGFGPVGLSNLQAAKLHAYDLEQKRRRTKR